MANSAFNKSFYTIFVKIISYRHIIMAGIYIHVPFCKSRCIYCDFFSTTSLDFRDKYVNTVCQELKLRKGYVKGECIGSIYLGGGTPSQLEPVHIVKLLQAIKDNFVVSDDAEITLEGNPDDMTLEFLRAIHDIGINRLSMGVQSFDDSRLKFLRRRHSGEEAVNAVRRAQECGFKNISIDLIFGFPDENMDAWDADIERAINLGIQHISAYALTYEEGTALHKMLIENKVKEIDEELFESMYYRLTDRLSEAGFRHYEISNFCLPGFHSRHNSSYWNGYVYLGVGTAAHSYDGNSRQWNPSDIKIYTECIDKGQECAIKERLDRKQQYDEYIMTRLRTDTGIAIDELRKSFGEYYYTHFMKCSATLIKSGLLKISCNGKNISLTRQGLFISDSIIVELMA